MSEVVKKEKIYITELKNDRFAIHAKYSVELHEAIKKIDDRIWNADFLYWSMPCEHKVTFLDSIMPLGYVPIKSKLLQPTKIFNKVQIKIHQTAQTEEILEAVKNLRLYANGENKVPEATNRYLYTLDFSIKNTICQLLR